MISLAVNPTSTTRSPMLLTSRRPRCPSIADQEAFLSGRKDWRAEASPRPVIRYGDDDPVWFAVRTNPRCEDRACASLGENGFEVFAPKGLKVIIHKRSKKRIEREFHLLVGYVFVAMPSDPKGRHWGLARECHGVKAPIGFDGQPVQFPTQQIELLRETEARGMLRVRSFLRGPGHDFKVGERLRIGDGPFSGFYADVIDVASRQSIRLLMEIMGRATEIDFPIDGKLERT